MIAIDRALHFVILTLLAVAVFLIASHEAQLRSASTGCSPISREASQEARCRRATRGLIGKLDELFSLDRGTLQLVGVGLAGYAVLEAAEAVGLWFQRRWAEYLTFVVTTLLLPLEVYELTASISWFKVVALVVNVRSSYTCCSPSACSACEVEPPRISPSASATRGGRLSSEPPRARSPQTRRRAASRASRPRPRTGSPCEGSTRSIGSSSRGRSRSRSPASVMPLGR